MKFATALKLIAVPVAAGLVLWLEKRWPLRVPVEPTAIRTRRNLLMAGSAAAAMICFEQPVIRRLTALVKERRLGLLRIHRLPRALETVLALLLLDYTLYLWHMFAHRNRFLWRFHLVHHADVDLDASTAFRFHFGEILISVAWRAMQIVLIGPSAEAMKLWQALMLPAVLFHHSNIRLPDDLDKRLSRIVITPELHGIHHSVVESETNSNWATILSVWDRLHGTLRTGIEQRAIVIGAPGIREHQGRGFGDMLLLPFRGGVPELPGPGVAGGDEA